MNRDEVLSHRIRAQQLDAEPDSRDLLDAAILDVGVQDSGTDGASWALANRGVRLDGPKALERHPDVALVWTLRVAPHYYRRRELADVLVATSPWSDRDAGKRLVGADKPLVEAGLTPRQGLAEVAAEMRRVVSQPTVKGEVSGTLSQRLAPAHLRDCRACGATHPWEGSFRMAALQAGLELEPGTSPPVLRRIPDWPDRAPGPAADVRGAPAHLQVVRNYLRFLGPATPQEVATFLDTSVAEVKTQWPADAVEVTVDGKPRWLLDPASGHVPRAVRLLGPYDLLLQGRDWSVLVPDQSRHKALWPVLGRPGAVLVGTDIAGTWRP